MQHHIQVARRAIVNSGFALARVKNPRAFFHARDDRYIAELIVASPVVAERSPALVEQAQRALAGAPPSVQ